jgi:hypothetical protein
MKCNEVDVHGRDQADGSEFMTDAAISKTDKSELYGRRLQAWDAGGAPGEEGVADWNGNARARTKVRHRNPTNAPPELKC